MAEHLSSEDAKILLQLCRTGRLYDVEKGIAAGKSIRVPRKRRGHVSRLQSTSDSTAWSNCSLVTKPVRKKRIEHSLWRFQRNAWISWNSSSHQGAQVSSIPLIDVLVEWEPAMIRFFLDHGADAITAAPFALAFRERIRTPFASSSSTRRRILSLHRNFRMLTGRFSPDGRFITYMVVDKTSRTDLMVRPVSTADGSGSWKIAESVKLFGSGVWRRDGKALYYVGLDQSVMVAEVKTAPTFSFSTPQVLFRPAGAVPDSIADVSIDGERFLALPPPRGPKLQQITIFDRSGNVTRKIGEPGLYSQPLFSPDATRLAVRKTDQKNGQQDIWIVDIATGKSTQLTNDNTPRSSPMWSPDGRYILYTTFRNMSDFAVERKAANGSGGEEVLFRYTHGAGLDLTDISADGKTLICESGGVILDIPLTGSDPLARTAIESLREEFDDTTGRLSPDARFLAFRSDEAQAERFEVYVRPFDTAKGMPGDTKWRVSKDGAMGMLSWRGDGKEIFFRGLDLDSNDLRVMAVEVSTAPEFHAGTPKLLFKLPGPINGNIGNVSRDGKQFVFAVNVPAGN